MSDDKYIKSFDSSINMCTSYTVDQLADMVKEVAIQKIDRDLITISKSIADLLIRIEILENDQRIILRDLIKHGLLND